MSKKIERVGFATLDLAGQDEEVLVMLRVAPVSRCLKTQRPGPCRSRAFPFAEMSQQANFKAALLQKRSGVH
jgi:hypothetical protein